MKKLFMAFLALIFFANFALQAVCPHCHGMRDDCMEAREGGKGASGKWRDNHTPKRGWTCQGAEDLGAGNTQRCQMCEREEVRYIHHMRHGDQNAITLQVGCICSGYMEGRFDGDVVLAVQRAKNRNSKLVNRANRREKFAGLNAWEVNGQDESINTRDGNHIVIRRHQPNQFGSWINDHWLQQFFPSIQAAKLAAFDALYPAQIN
jgi:hypothetical protein